MIILVLICLGLFTRSRYCPASFFQEYGGDILWASMMYFIFAFIFPKQSIMKLAITTTLFAYLIECSQLIDVAWLNALRQTPLRYLLGQGFVWSDLLCYTIGVGLAVIVELGQKKG